MNPRSLMWPRVRAGAAVAATLLAAVTLVWHEWIEVVFGVDPDRHSGSLEWLIVAAITTIAIVLGLSARRAWRRALPQAA